jgi:hypothetical protein
VSLCEYYEKYDDNYVIIDYDFLLLDVHDVIHVLLEDNDFLLAYRLDD